MELAEPSVATTLLGAAAWVAGEPTSEQGAVLAAFSRAFGLVDGAVAPTAPDAIIGRVTPNHARRTLQLAIVVGLCRHPFDEAQFVRVSHLAEALSIGAEELALLDALVHESAEVATEDFQRAYDSHLSGLEEERLVGDDGRLSLEWVTEMRRMDEGSLGRAYIDFHVRHGFRLPGEGTPVPAYYVSHDMNHVLAGYEPTGPGEIALGAFKLSMGDTDDNWMAFMANLLIHEAGLLKHGEHDQFVPYGGEIYPDAEGQGALHLPGAAALVAEAFRRGAATSMDFSQADHLAMAPRPLVDLRAELGVLARADGFDGGLGRAWTRVD